jgi:hypothetical protein
MKLSINNGVKEGKKVEKHVTKAFGKFNPKVSLTSRRVKNGAYKLVED